GPDLRPPGGRRDRLAHGPGQKPDLHPRGPPPAGTAGRAGRPEKNHPGGDRPVTTPIKSAQVLNLNYLARAERDPAALRRDFDDMVLYMKGSTAIHHGEYVRTCYLPKLFTESQFAALKADMRVLYGIFAKVIDAWYADPAYRALFRFSPQAEDLILHADRSVSMLPMARIDFFYNELTAAPAFWRSNTAGSTPTNEPREPRNARGLSEGYRTLTGNHRSRRCELFDSWVNTVVRLWRRRGETGPLPA